MTFTYPKAPPGHFFKIQRNIDWWTYEDLITLQLRRKIWIFSRKVDAVLLETLDRAAVVWAAEQLLEQFPEREAFQAQLKEIPKANKILKDNK